MSMIFNLSKSRRIEKAIRKECPKLNKKGMEDIKRWLYLMDVLSSWEDFILFSFFPLAIFILFHTLIAFIVSILFLVLISIFLGRRIKHAEKEMMRLVCANHGYSLDIAAFLVRVLKEKHRFRRIMIPEPVRTRLSVYI
jgi:hypothetical protein